VVVPAGAIIFWGNTNDPVSGGLFLEDPEQLAFGSHVESIFFPIEGGPAGRYMYYVREFGTGSTQCPWTFEVFVHGEVVESRMGFGESEIFSFGKCVQYYELTFFRYASDPFLSLFNKLLE
jgi:hypothetical protein